MKDYLEPAIDLQDPASVPIFDELSFWSSRVGRLLFEHLELRPDLEGLDVGCGLGFPLIELAQVHGPSCRFVGIDPWKPALERARWKVGVYGLDNVEVVEGDAGAMPFPDGRFDLIVSNLGVNNFAAPGAALAECFRVARPGARLVITTNIRGHMRELYAVYRGMLQETGRTEALSRLEVEEAHRVSRASLWELVQGAGFRVTRSIEDAFTLRYLNGSALLRHFLTRIGFLDGWRQVAGPAEERAVLAELEARLNTLARERGHLELTVPMLYLEAERP